MQILKAFEQAGPAKYPEGVHIIITKTPDGRYNPMSASWVMFTSIEPRMLAVSIGFERYTYELIQAQGEFVAAIPSADMGEEVEFFGSNSGRDMDKFAELGTPTQKASEIDCVLLKEARANFECRVTGSHGTGDHMIFSAEIVAAHVHENPAPRLYVTGRKTFGGLVPDKSG